MCRSELADGAAHEQVQSYGWSARNLLRAAEGARQGTLHGMAVREQQRLVGIVWFALLPAAVYCLLLPLSCCYCRDCQVIYEEEKSINYETFSFCRDIVEMRNNIDWEEQLTR